MSTSRPCVSALTALVLLALAAPSHSHPRPMPAVARSSDGQIRALFDRWTQAFEARDLDRVMSMYAPGDTVVAYDVVPPLEYRGIAAYRRDYQTFFDQYGGPIHVEYRHMRVMSSGDLGVVESLERITGRLKSGARTDLWVRATSVVRRIGGRWLIVHDHVSVPVDFATGKAMLNLTP